MHSRYWFTGLTVGKVWIIYRASFLTWKTSINIFFFVFWCDKWMCQRMDHDVNKRCSSRRLSKAPQLSNDNVNFAIEFKTMWVEKPTKKKTFLSKVTAYVFIGWMNVHNLSMYILIISDALHIIMCSNQFSFEF